MHVLVLTFVQVVGIPGTDPIGTGLVPSWFCGSGARGNRSAGYLIRIGLIPSGFSSSFVEWFTHSASRLNRFTIIYYSFQT